MTNESSHLDRQVKAVCKCGKESKQVTFRNLKNKWPHCSGCPTRRPMKVITYADDTISDRN